MSAQVRSHPPGRPRSHWGRLRDGGGLLGGRARHLLDPVRARDDLVGDHQARLGRTLHGIDVVLVRVAARKEEVADRRGLRRAVLVLAGLLAIERLAQLDNGAPRALEGARRGEERVHLLDGVSDNLLLAPGEGTRVEDSLHEGTLALLVVLAGGDERQVGEARELGVCGVEQVVDARSAAVRLVTGDVLHGLHVGHLSDPAVEAELDGGDGDAVEVIDVVEHGHLAEGLGQYLLDAGQVQRSDDAIKLARALLARDLDGGHLGGHAVGIRLVEEVLDGGAQVDLDAALVEVLEDRIVQEGLRRAVQHAKHGSLGADGEEHEDGKHAARRDVVAIDEAEGVRDRVPHAVDRAARAALAHEPLRECDVVELAHHVHASVEVDQSADNWARAQRERVRKLVADAELLRLRERLQPAHRRPDREAEV
mmetsp:Transcript_40101/g.99783  ORF Transcript_40101/g.99783 Transcript_40101/m.99783 type:complete len:424 (-) Transcript_40101:413-1684(-)